MTDLSCMLGELGDCLDDLADDVAPAQVEADAQNRAVRLARRKRALARHIRRHPDDFSRASAGGLAELGKFSIGGAFGSLAKGITAPLRIVGKVATGDFKGALRAAGDPLGIAALARKGKHTVADVKGAISRPGTAALSLANKLGAGGALRTAAGLGGAASMLARGGMPEIKIKCIPCDGNTAVATDIAKKVVPEMQQVRKLLDDMELSRKATSEHNKKKQQKAWRKEVIRLLKAIQEKRCK